MSTSVSGRLIAGQGAFVLACAFGAGILAATNACPSPTACLIAFSGVAVVALVLTLRNQRLSTAALLLAIFAAGAYDASLSLATAPDSVAGLIAPSGPAPDGAVLSFRGTALGRIGKSTRDQKTLYRYALKVDQLKLAGRFRPASGTAIVDSPDVLEYGSRIEGVAFFHLPEPATVPGQFDYRRYLANNGIDCLARADAPGALAAVGVSPWYAVPALFARARRNLIDRLGALGLDKGGVIPAVLLADRTSLSQSDRDSFVRSGTMHLLSISGLHLAIVAGVFLWLLARFGAPPGVSAIVTLVAATLYTFLVGPQPPIVRSAVMLALFCFGVIVDRETRALAVVSTAALLMWIAGPRQIFDAGFQLSFVAVLGLFYIGSPLGRFFSWAVSRRRFPLRTLARDVAFGFGVSLGAGAAVAPLGIWHFGTVSFISPLANLLLIPTTWFMVVAGFAAAGLSFVSTTLASAVALSSSGAETALVWLAHAFAKVPFAYAATSWPLWAVIAAYAYLILLGLALSLEKRVFAVVLFGLATANSLVWSSLLVPAHERPADIIVINDRRIAAAVLSDGNGRTAIFLSRRGNADSARSVLCPLLLSRGVSRIDLLVETAGADARVRDMLRESFAVGEVLRQRRFAYSPDSPAPLIADEPKGFSPGDRVTVAPGFTLAFHAAAPINFLQPDEPWYEGLIVEASLSARRAVLVLDATDACLAVTKSHIKAHPDALALVNSPGESGLINEFVRALGPAQIGDSIVFAPDMN